MSDYAWHRNFLDAGVKIAKAVEGWRGAMTKEELLAWDGDLECFDGLREGLIELVHNGIRALCNEDAVGGEPYARRIVEKALDGPVPVSALAYGVFSLCKLAEVLPILEGQFPKGYPPEGVTIPFRGEVLQGVVDQLRSIQDFNRGESDAGFKLIEAFKAFVQQKDWPRDGSAEANELLSTELHTSRRKLAEASAEIHRLTKALGEANDELDSVPVDAGR